MGRLFGTDGVRGVAGTELTPELALGLGRALVRAEREQGVARPRIVVGRDPRPSGPMLEAALTAGVTSAGGDVVPLGILPTPGVAYCTTQLSADAGAVISASHNPVPDNGIKFFARDGFKLDDTEEDRIEQLLQRYDEAPPTGLDVGRVIPKPEAVESYIDHLVAAADADVSGLKVVVDCANGAAANITPAVLRRLGCEVHPIYTATDGRHINVGCGSTHPEALAATVTEVGADLGLAHDGDADRLIAVDHTGTIVDGDKILAILALRRREREGLKAVVTTVMTNLGFTQAMEAHGVEVVRTKVGDRYVLAAMLAGGHPLGGEQSGHVIIADHATTGDGALTAVRLVSAVADSGRTLRKLASVMERLPQVLVNVKGVDRDRLDSAERVWEAVKQAEADLGDSGRVLLRASGTEPLVRVMVEADTEDRAQSVADELAEVTRSELAA